MLLGTIIRDMAVLHYQDMPNEKILFSQLHPLEWKAFVKYAAGKKEKKNLLVPYFFLSADFVEVKNTKNPFIIEELPKLREAYYRFLAGENFPGVDEKLRLTPEEALRRHGGNPAFAPYKEKILKMFSVHKTKRLRKEKNESSLRIFRTGSPKSGHGKRPF